MNARNLPRAWMAVGYITALLTLAALAGLVRGAPVLPLVLAALALRGAWLAIGWYCLRPEGGQ